MEIPADRRFTKEHEWAKAGDKGVTIGISDFAQGELGDVVFVDLPEAGDKVSKGEGFMTVESVKAVSDIYAPVSGVIVEVNSRLDNEPELVNQDPWGDGWLVIIEPEAKEQVLELMDAAAYQGYLHEIAK